MTGMVEKNYGDALFELILEEDASSLRSVQEELAAVDQVLTDVPELIKLVKTPTVELKEKLSIVEEAFAGKVSENTYRFLMVLTESGRLAYFGRIRRYFDGLCNERLGIAEVTVVSTEPISDDLKAKIRAKMAEITGKTVTLREETDPALIGGVVIRYGGRSYDGSVRAKLDALKKEIGGVIG
ncbi:MAG: ATP synthase F1 subunit delta [Bacteroides sp.]|nr:ATP synthase F1 subunit delta [Eubacterium sp.]MCM1419088.1 ATP synthase F1 subunit delta [Roseburia sp.]MCM1462950.1 ATP synthase F1 subunit delta [Bacteroides sp.]